MWRTNCNSLLKKIDNSPDYLVAQAVFAVPPPRIRAWLVRWCHVYGISLLFNMFDLLAELLRAYTYRHRHSAATTHSFLLTRSHTSQQMRRFIDSSNPSNTSSIHLVNAPWSLYIQCTFILLQEILTSESVIFSILYPCKLRSLFAQPKNSQVSQSDDRTVTKSRLPPLYLLARPHMLAFQIQTIDTRRNMPLSRQLMGLGLLTRIRFVLFCVRMTVRCVFDQILHHLEVKCLLALTKYNYSMDAWN